MRMILPLVLGLVGTGVGVGAAKFAPGNAAHPEDEKTGTAHEAPADGDKGHAPEPAEKDGEALEYVRMTNQFVVPIVHDDTVTSMVVLSLSLEVDPGLEEKIYALEPKLRDRFLRVLFDHANMGGFGAHFTDVEMLDVLRRALRQAARQDLGDVLHDVLIIDIARQDV